MCSDGPLFGRTGPDKDNLLFERDSLLSIFIDYFFFNRANIIYSLCSDLRAVNQCSHRSNKLPEFTEINGQDYYEKIFYVDPVA